MVTTLSRTRQRDDDVQHQGDGPTCRHATPADQAQAPHHPDRGQQPALVEDLGDQVPDVPEREEHDEHHAGHEPGSGPVAAERVESHEQAAAPATQIEQGTQSGSRVTWSAMFWANRNRTGYAPRSSVCQGQDHQPLAPARTPGLTSAQQYPQRESATVHATDRIHRPWVSQPAPAGAAGRAARGAVHLPSHNRRILAPTARRRSDR